MKYIILTIAIIALLGCRNNKSENVPGTDSATVNETKPVADTSKSFVVDDYPVPDDFFVEKSGESAHRKKIDDIYSLEKVWLGNDTLSQTLVFDLATDYHRMIIFHFYSEDIPQKLIERLELHNEEGYPVSFDQKKPGFGKFVKDATKINSYYFTTVKGFKLGDDKQKVLEVYGKSDTVIQSENIEVLDWSFNGDQMEEINEELKGKPLAKDSYGHQVTMFFRNDKLVAIIFFNDIP
jgi:hypothetical protein